MANIVVRQYQLDITPNGIATVVNLNQFENGRSLVFALVGEGEIDIPSGSTAIIAGVKPDDAVYSATCTVDINEETVTVQETVQLTAAAGNWYAKIKITDPQGATVATGMIDFRISKDLIPEDAQTSSSDIQGLIAEAQQYAEAAETVAEEVTNSFAANARTMVFSDLNTTAQEIIGAINENKSTNDTQDTSISTINSTLANIPVIKVYDDSTSIDITIGPTGYTKMSKPSAVLGKHIINIFIRTWTNNTTAVAFAPMSDSSAFFYAAGTPNGTLTGANISYVYYD